MMIQRDTFQVRQPEAWLWRCLVADHGQLSASDERRLFAERSTAVPFLIAMVEDRASLSRRAPGGGCAPVHAAELLGVLQAADAIPALLALLADLTTRDRRHVEVATALWAMGPAVLEPALRARAESVDARYRVILGIVVTDLGVRDERLFELLVEMLEEAPLTGAKCLARYGDPRAIEHLGRMLDACAVASDALASDEVLALGDAIEQLGGTLTPAQERTYQDAAAEEALAGEMIGFLASLIHGRARAGGSYAPSKTARLHAHAAGRKRRTRRKQRKASRKRNRR